MKKLLNRMIKHGWAVEPPGEEKLFPIIEKKYSISLPADYKEFMLLCNGGEGDLVAYYVSLWKLQDVTQLNSDYKINHYLKDNFIGFGTDGGDDCWAFNYVDNHRIPKIVKIPLGDLDLASVVTVANTFTEFIQNSLEK